MTAGLVLSWLNGSQGRLDVVIGERKHEERIGSSAIFALHGEDHGDEQQPSYMYQCTHDEIGWEAFVERQGTIDPSNMVRRQRDLERLDVGE